MISLIDFIAIVSKYFPKIQLLSSAVELNVEHFFLDMAMCNNQSLIGILLGLFSGLLFAVSTYFTSVLLQTTHLHPFYLALCRFTAHAIGSGPFVAARKDKFHFGTNWYQWGLVLTRSISGVVTVSFIFFSLEYIPISDTAITMTISPILTSIISHFVLKERLLISDIPLFALAIVGVTFIIRPTFIFDNISVDDVPYENRIIGTSLAFAAALCEAGIVIPLRKLKGTSFVTISFQGGVAGGLMACLPVYFVHGFTMPPCYYDRVLVLAASGAALVGQFCLASACQQVTANIVTLTKSTDSIFAFLIQALIAGKKANLFSLFGLLCSLTALSLLAFRTVMIEKYGEKRNSTKLLRITFLFFK